LKDVLNRMMWPALGVVLLDQVTKIAVLHYLQVYETVPVIPGFFDLVHVRNRGMAFGIMNKADGEVGYYFLVIATLVSLAVIFFFVLRSKQDDPRMTVGLSLILGGATGNLIDRIRFHEVIDFLDFYAGSFHWPAFNIADSAITLGTLWVALNLYLQGRKRG
jgi:signal peptidase II